MASSLSKIVSHSFETGSHTADQTVNLILPKLPPSRTPELAFLFKGEQPQVNTRLA